MVKIQPLVSKALAKLGDSEPDSKSFMEIILFFFAHKLQLKKSALAAQREAERWRRAIRRFSV